MSSLASLAAALEEVPTLEARVDTLLQELATAIKATSNDQNIQALASDLRTAAPSLARAVTKEPTDA